MKTLPEEEKKLFIEKHFGKEMFFKEYYKYKFYYEFVDENGKLYTLACGDVDCDIYRNHWCSVEKIGAGNWLNCFVHDIYI